MGASGQRLGEVQLRERLDLVDRWRESGLPMKEWAQSQGLELGVLTGAVAYESGWRAKLLGQAVKSMAKIQGFVPVTRLADQVAIGKPVILSDTVRMECAGVVMYWPLSTGVELARWLQSLRAVAA
jgi:hypothetical protein